MEQITFTLDLKPDADPEALVEQIEELMNDGVISDVADWMHDYGSLPVPEVGQRVIFANEDIGDAGMRVPAGAQGTVIKADRETIVIKMDAPWDKNASDDGTWAFYPECGPQPHPNGFDMNPLQQFHYFCMYIKGRI